MLLLTFNCGDAARFSPDDKYSRQRVLLKKRFGLLPTQMAPPKYWTIFHQFIPLVISELPEWSLSSSSKCTYLHGIMNFVFYIGSKNGCSSHVLLVVVFGMKSPTSVLGSYVLWKDWKKCSLIINNLDHYLRIYDCIWLCWIQSFDHFCNFILAVFWRIQRKNSLVLWEFRSQVAQLDIFLNRPVRPNSEVGMLNGLVQSGIESELAR